jgi:hypothetical protein
MRRCLGLILVVAGGLACGSGSAASSGSGGSGTGTSGATGTSTGGGSDTSSSTSGTSSGGIPVTGTPLGQICDQNHACHDAQECVSAAKGGTSFCTIECARTSGSAKAPPDGGNQFCASAPTYGGTGACDLNIKNSDGSLTWDCGLECGMAGSQNFGMCPTGLTCSSKNICQ